MVSLLRKGLYKYKTGIELFSHKFETIKVIKSFITKYGEGGKNVNPEIYMMHYTVDKKQNIYLANNSCNDYSIDVFNRQGKHIETIKKSYKSILRTKKEYKKEEKYLRSITNIRNFNYSDVKFYTSIYHCFFDNKNRLWVLTPKTQQEEQSGFKFDIFENGKYLNSLFINLDFEFLFNGGFIKIYDDKLVVSNIYNSRVTIYKILKGENHFDSDPVVVGGRYNSRVTIYKILN